MIEHESVKLEETELEDLQDGETKEIEFQLKDFNQISKEALSQTADLNILVDYTFAIKSSYQKVSSPPPEV